MGRVPITLRTYTRMYVRTLSAGTRDRGERTAADCRITDTLTFVSRPVAASRENNRSRETAGSVCVCVRVRARCARILLVESTRVRTLCVSE